MIKTSASDKMYLIYETIKNRILHQKIPHCIVVSAQTEELYKTIVLKFPECT